MLSMNNTIKQTKIHGYDVGCDKTKLLEVLNYNYVLEELDGIPDIGHLLTEEYRKIKYCRRCRVKAVRQ